MTPPAGGGANRGGVRGKGISDLRFAISYCLMGVSLVLADPGWNPGLIEAEALAEPGRFFN